MVVLYSLCGFSITPLYLDDFENTHKKSAVLLAYHPQGVWRNLPINIQKPAPSSASIFVIFLSGLLVAKL